MSDVKSWLSEHKLQLNNGKTGAMLVSSRRTSTADSVPTSLLVGLSDIKFANQVKNLDVTVDFHFTLHQHVTNVCSSANVYKIASHCLHSCEPVWPSGKALGW